MTQDSANTGKAIGGRGRRTFPDAVVTKADEKLRTGMAPRELREVLLEEFGAANVPTIRTLQHWAGRNRPPDPSDLWSLRDSITGAAARPVLEALGELIKRAEGRPVGITRAEAAYLIRVSRAAPDMPPWLAYTLARHYVYRKQAEMPATDIDAFLALRPWANEGAFANLQWMWEAGVANLTPPRPSDRGQGGYGHASFGADVYQALVEQFGSVDFTGGNDGSA